MRLRVENMGHEGVAVGRNAGKVVFVRGAIPGELVDVEVIEDRSKFQKAQVTAVVEPSPHRVEHPWALGAAGATGAADFGHIDPAFQRELKSQVISHTLRRIGGQDLSEQIGRVAVQPVDGTDGWHTRTRIDLIKMDTGFGMHREGTRDLLAIDAMPLAHPAIAALDLFGTRWDGFIKPGERVRAVVPAVGEPVLVVGGSAFSAPGVPASPQVTEQVLDDDTRHTYQLTAGGFWQVHRKAPQTLLCAVERAAKVEPGMAVADLYSGAGLFSVPLAKAAGPAGKLYGIEGSKTAAADSKRNLARMPWAKARAGYIDQRTIAKLPRLDVAVADPPRKGLGKATAKALADSSAKRIVLISCDPGAMARDVSQLVESGRQVKSIESFDIFPNTHHMEVVTSFE